MRNNKRGFTIVELVIVIAIIAILAAVLIPTFVGMIKKANQSSDTQLIRNLNTALALESSLAQQPARNAHEAFEYAENQGYKVATIVAKSEYNIAYDVAGARFVLLDATGEQHKYLFPLNAEENETGDIAEEDYVNYFVVCKKADDAKGHSIYAGPDWTDENPVVSVGFDAGEKTFTSINYSHSGTAQNVVIRTNGGELNINDETNGSIYHYGDKGLVKVLLCSKNSYHECGSPEELQLKDGRVVFEPTHNVGAFNLIPTSKNGKVTTDDCIVASNNGAKIPAVGFADVDCEIGESVLVLEVQILQNETSMTDQKFIFVGKNGEGEISEPEFYDDKDGNAKSTSVSEVMESAKDVTLTLTPSIFWHDLEECGLSQKNINGKMGSAQNVTVQQCIDSGNGFTKYWVKLGTLSQNIEVTQLGIGASESFDLDSKTSDSIGNASSIVDRVFYQDGKDLYVCCSFISDYYILGEKLVINNTDLFAAPRYMVKNLSLTYGSQTDGNDKTTVGTMAKQADGTYLYTYKSNTSWKDFYNYSFNIGEGERLFISRIEEHQANGTVSYDTSMSYSTNKNGGIYTWYYGSGPSSIDELEKFYDIHTVLVVKDGEVYMNTFRVNWTQEQ